MQGGPTICYGNDRSIGRRESYNGLALQRYENMVSNGLFAEVAALSGDPARASMLHALMDGRALTATELARAAGIAPQTASGHLNRMTAIGLLSVEKQGRHRYHRLATPSIAHMLESIMQVASELAPGRRKLSVGPKEAALRKARTCYDHFAGQLGVSIADALIREGHVELTGDAGILTESGIARLAAVGMDIAPMLARRTKRSGRVLCRPCLDWSERRPHLAGIVGAAICEHSMQQGWTRRLDGTRAVLVTPEGERVFREGFGAKFT
jgi:DNA-binding transcriptional ArsR family regulator